MKTIFFQKNKSKRLKSGNETQIREANSMGGLFIFTGLQKVAKTMGGLHFHDFRDANVWEGCYFRDAMSQNDHPCHVLGSWRRPGGSGGPLGVLG